MNASESKGFPGAGYHIAGVGKMVGATALVISKE
jgi:hypothetical protein